MTSIGIDYDETVTQEELMSKIDELNNDSSIHGEKRLGLIDSFD